MLMGEVALHLDGLVAAVGDVVDLHGAIVSELAAALRLRQLESLGISTACSEVLGAAGGVRIV